MNKFDDIALRVVCILILIPLVTLLYYSVYTLITR